MFPILFYICWQTFHEEKFPKHFLISWKDVFRDNFPGCIIGKHISWDTTIWKISINHNSTRHDRKCWTVKALWLRWHCSCSRSWRKTRVVQILQQLRQPTFRGVVILETIDERLILQLVRQTLAQCFTSTTISSSTSQHPLSASNTATHIYTTKLRSQTWRELKTSLLQGPRKPTTLF